MKVILMENIETLGVAGTVKDVANGYARNYLLPRGMAVPASAEALKRLERQRAAIERRAASVADEARSMADRLAATTVYIYAKSGEQNRLYGSVTTADIATALANQHGLTIDRHNISLAEPIHRLGNYTANVKLASGASGKLNVAVDNEANRGKPRPESAVAAPAEATSATEATAAETTTAAETAPVASVAAETAPVTEATTAEAASATEIAPAVEATTAEAAPAAEAMTTTMTEDAVTLTPHPHFEVVETADNEVASNAGESSAAAIAAATPAEPDAPVSAAQDVAAEDAETGLEGDAS